MRSTGRVFCSDFGRRLYPLLRLLAGVSLGLLDVAMMHIARGVVTKQYEIYNLIYIQDHIRRLFGREKGGSPCGPVAWRRARQLRGAECCVALKAWPNDLTLTFYDCMSHCMTL